MPSIKERLLPSLRTPGFRRLLRLAVWLVGIAYFGFALIILLLRYAILPQIENYRGDLERMLSEALHRPVAIARIEAGWQGLRPRLDLHDLRINDESGRPALSLEHVEAIVGWTSLVYFRPRLHRLQVDAPELAVRRERDGHLFVAGLPVDTDSNSGGFGKWLLDQHEIIVTDARVTWTDEMRAAPPLSMSRLNLRIENSFRHHRFGLVFEPPGEFASAVDIRGDLQGSNLDDLAAWRGDLYFQVSYADLAVWRTWVDYPVELPRGRGSLSVWLAFAHLQLTDLTADVALADTQMRLAKALPMLDLQKIDGRMQWQHLKDGFAASVAHLALSTREGLKLQPADVSLRWQAREGEFDASDLDLGTLNQLAGYLPLPKEIRAPLTAYAPGGRLHGLRLGWTGSTDQPFASWRLNGRFDGLRLAAQGEVPGFSGIAGEVAGDEKGGSLTLSGKDAVLDLPAVFPEPRIALTAVDIKAKWKRGTDGVEVKLEKAAFHNKDAQGSASGIYVWQPGTPGRIDLEAKLTRAEGSAVWRYMPSVVGKDARDWLRAAILGGASPDVALKLKGDLKRFPFTDGSGVFTVKGSFRGATLRYASTWPQITDIAGALEFNAARMTITASSGKIFGANVGPVKAEIADLEIPEELLTVEGKANGPTAEFLKFIEGSPVGDSIDHFTQDMTAGGSGELNLKLNLPLRHLEKTQVAGGYRFDGNRLVPDPAMLPLEAVRGRIDFTSSELTAKNVQARMLGGPVKLDVKTQGDGVVLITASGDSNITQLRQQVPNPVFEHLAGGTRWNGTVRVRKKVAEVKIVSDLRGVSSSLPEPFNKTAGDAMPLVFERKPPEPQRPASRRGKEPVIQANRDMLEVTLGKALRMKVLRRIEGGMATMDRGVIAIGDAAPKWPERGVILAVSMPRFDADLLRRMTNSTNEGAESSKGGGSGITQLDLKTNEAVVFGRLLHDVRITGSRPGPTWNLDVKSREVVGRLDWFDGETDKLSGRIGQFSLPGAVPGSDAPVEVLKELPNIDLVFDNFTLHGMNFGEVRVAAENKGGYWNANIGVKNDDATLNGQGTWRPSTDAPDTRFDFKLKAKSVEKTLGRVGYVNAVRRGNANMEGSLSWNGAPYDVDYATLNGNLKLDAHDGQFNKLEPGVGRLLGIISLQSLPRRITLDFSDIFSEGFAFDSIAAQASVTRGIIETRDMKIEGPAAKVQMAGKVDLTQETQDLKVRVQPALGQSVATGVLLANPAIGATTWLLNKVFGNPLDRAFAYDYAVTGKWADPKVEKLGAQPGAAIRKEAAQ